MQEPTDDLFEPGVLRTKPAKKDAEARRELKLSPSSLNLFTDCPRCFWLYVNKNMKRPGAPVATITNGLDRVVKEYFNQYRAKGVLPPFLEGKVRGKLIVAFPKRGWLDMRDELLSARLGGYLDELIQLDDTHYAVLDHKTRGSAPETVHKAYQLQMDVYTLLLEANNLPTQKTAYIVYYIPKKITTDGDFQFEALVKEIKTDPERAKVIFQKAVALLRNPLPEINTDCEFCKWTKTTGVR